MDALQTAQDFIEYCREAKQAALLAPAFQRALGELGFRYFACASHVDPLRARQAVMVINYPKSWVEHYSERQLHRIDPVFLRAERTRGAFFWDEVFRGRLTQPQQRMLRNARQYGLAHGYTIPIHGPAFAPGTPASCSIVPDSKQLPARRFLAAQIMAQYLFDRAAQLQRSIAPVAEIPQLCRRERQCLELVALGKSDEEIATVLGISPFTAHSYIEGAKRRLGLHSRVQAVVYAAGTRQLAVGEILRPLQRLVSLAREVPRAARGAAVRPAPGARRRCLRRGD